VAAVLIAQCDVFRNPGGPDDAIPFVVVLQDDAVHWTSSVVVAPLVSGRPAADSRLTPVFFVEGRNCALMVQDPAPVPRRLLVDRVASLVRERHRIIAALDLLFTGF
jgi:hypothetical protein